MFKMRCDGCGRGTWVEEREAVAHLGVCMFCGGSHVLRPTGDLAGGGFDKVLAGVSAAADPVAEIRARGRRVVAESLAAPLPKRMGRPTGNSGPLVATSEGLRNPEWGVPKGVLERPRG